jgi:hypothetical protein
MRPLVALLVATAVVGVVPARAQQGRAPEVGPVPVGSVAVVGESQISRQRFDRWLRTAVVGDAPRFWAAPAVPRPPRHRDCVASLRKRLGKRGPPSAGLRRRCARLFDKLMPGVMTFLVQSRWVVLEARQRGIAVSERRVVRSFRAQRREAFPTQRAYRRFLRRAGMRQSQILFRIRVDLLQQALTEHVTRSAPPGEQGAALERFTREFRRRYRAQTRCASQYQVRDCGPPG